MALSSKLASKAMGAMERTKKFLGLPGYDEATAAAQKEMDDEIARLKKLEKSKELTPREEKKLDNLMSRKMREEGAETETGMARERKGKSLTEKEKKEMQESLDLAYGGMAKKKKPMKMEKGGYAKCGASNPPAGGSRNK
jgi:hypothetical protein